MELRTLEYKKKNMDLTIKYIHFDQYGSDYYDEEVKRLKQIMDNYEPTWYSVYELVQIIRTIFRDNDENYMHLDMHNDSQQYELDFYGETLGKYSHKTSDYSSSYDDLGFAFSSTELEINKSLFEREKSDIDLVQNLKNAKPFRFDGELVKCVSLYNTFFGKPIDAMNPKVEMELAYMFYMLNQYEMLNPRDNYLEYDDNTIMPSFHLQNLVLKLKTFVKFDSEEEKKINECLNEYVNHGVNDIGKALAVHFEHRTPEEQLSYLENLCLAISGYSKQENGTRLLHNKD